MKKMVFFLCLLAAMGANAAQTKSVMELPSVSPYDGDTLRTNQRPVEGLPPISIRVFGIDTPEIRGKCEFEANLARQAKDRVKELVGNSPVKVYIYGWDKYGGRVVGDVILQSGQNLGEILIKEGLAVPYNGGKKKNWCAQ